MQFSIFAIIAALATFAATSPITDSSPAGVALRRSFNKADFTEFELANYSEAELLNTGKSRSFAVGFLDFTMIF